LAGFIFSVLAVTFEAVAVLGHPDVAPTPEHVVSLLNQDVVTTLSAPPSLLEGLSRLPAGIEALSQLEHVGYAGGPLSEHVGQILAPKLKHLCSLIGSTEYGFFHLISGGSSKWAYLRFHPDVGYRFDEISDGEFELVIPNDPKTRKYHGTTRTFPELDEYRTKDLYSIVPGEQGWMRYVGRRDDLIVLSNGEKVNPVPLEDIICSHPAVKGAVIVGEHRFLPSLLIELQDGFHGSGKELHEMLDTIWPIVAEANQTAPRFCRIPKSLIYFVPREKPFNRAGKGTIQRQVTIRKFANELRELYAAAEQGLLMEGLEFQNPYDRDSTRAFVKSLYTQSLDVERLSDEEDVFELGMDSLQVAIAIQKLRATLRSQHLEANPSQLNAQLIYSSPTVNKLSDALYSLIKGGGCPHSNGSVNASHDRFDYLQQVLDRYLMGLPTKLITGNRKDAGTFNVVLTGSTGSLGSYLLATLLSSPKVSKVICLNRSKDSEKRQRASQKSRGLAISWDGADKQRCEFLTADLLKPDLGLGDQRYERLVSEAATVIHCGWKVDFNHSLESFEKITLAGMRNLIDLSANSTSQAPILFVSSISTVLNWIDTHPDAPVPEAILHDLEAPEKLGYAESKYIGERLLEDFTRSSGIPNAVLRVGQIAGPVQSSSGCWNTQEWFPSLVASSKYLGMLPESLGKLDSIDWIPVDILALIIVQLLELIHDNVSNQGQSETRPSPAVYNLVNPKVTEWGALFPAVQDELGGESKVRIVPLEEWVQALENSASENHGYIVAENPAVKLLDFFKILGKGASRYAETSKLRYEVGRLVRDSPRAAKLGPVSPKWIRLWMKQWKL
jgi:thioester reductase-like protein